MKIGFSTENENFLASGGFFGQPKFNSSCDSDSLDAAVECEENLLAILVNCADTCSDDQACVGACQREFFINIEYCPCHSECTDGCAECKHWSCNHPCEDPENNPETDKCFGENVEKFNECTAACKNDMVCFNNCYLALGNANDLCPCGKFCEKGCPCMDCENCWECPNSVECNNEEDRLKCIELANEKLVECMSTCEGEACRECDQNHEDDLDNCPCQKNCPSGCPCPNFDCDLLNELADSCLDLSSNTNYQFCYDEQKIALLECMRECKVYECNALCQETFGSELEKCPCAPKCPSDCPCESYNCNAIEGTNTSILILYSYTNYAYDQHVLSPDGSSRVLDAFNYERETQIYCSCSVVLANKMWIFGGNSGTSFTKQLSSVAQCHLKTEGALPFELYSGAANTIDDQSALICFNGRIKECHSFDGSSFLTAASAKYEHYHTSLGKLSEGLIAISGYSSASGVTVELFANGKWYQQPDFPEERSFAYYSTITYENRLYIFGGYNRNGKSVHIGRMTYLGLEWSKGPELLLSRQAHRSILVGDEIYHLGGSGNIKTEKWTIKENEVTKESLDFELNNYYRYPEVFAINRNYCTFV